MLVSRLAVFALVAAGCSNEPASFSSGSRGAERVSLTVEDAPPGATTAPAAAVPDEAVAGQVFDKLDDSTIDDVTVAPAGGTTPAGDPSAQVDAASGKAPATAVDSATGQPVATTTDAASTTPAASPAVDVASQQQPAVTAAAPASSAPTATVPAGGTSAELTKKEQQACAALAGVSADRVKTFGAGQVRSGDVVAVKRTGGQAPLELDVSGPATAFLAGLCIFVAGNENQVKVAVGMKVERFVYVGHGNQSLTEIDVTATGSLANVFARLSGNGAILRVAGAGAHPCPAVAAKGPGSAFECK